MTELILTNAERLRMHEDQRVAAEYRAMRDAYPDASNARIINSMLASGKFKAKSFYGIRAALIRTGLVTENHRS